MLWDPIYGALCCGFCSFRLLATSKYVCACLQRDGVLAAAYPGWSLSLLHLVSFFNNIKLNSKGSLLVNCNIISYGICLLNWTSVLKLPFPSFSITVIWHQTWLLSSTSLKFLHIQFNQVLCWAFKFPINSFQPEAAIIFEGLHRLQNARGCYRVCRVLWWTCFC